MLFTAYRSFDLRVCLLYIDIRVPRSLNSTLASLQPSTFRVIAQLITHMPCDCCPPSKDGSITVVAHASLLSASEWTANISYKKPGLAEKPFQQTALMVKRWYARKSFRSTVRPSYWGRHLTKTARLGYCLRGGEDSVLCWYSSCLKFFIVFVCPICSPVL